MKKNTAGYLSKEQLCYVLNLDEPDLFEDKKDVLNCWRFIKNEEKTYKPTQPKNKTWSKIKKTGKKIMAVVFNK